MTTDLIMRVNVRTTTQQHGLSTEPRHDSTVMATAQGASFLEHPQHSSHAGGALLTGRMLDVTEILKWGKVNAVLLGGAFFNYDITRMSQFEPT